MSVDDKIAAWLAKRAKIKSTRTKMGLAGYAYLTAILKRQPLSSSALQQITRIQHTTANRFLVTLHTLKRVHIARWDQEPRRPLTPVYVYGAGTDAEPPTTRPNGRRIDGIVMPRKRICPSVIPFLRMMDTLDKGACTLRELCDEVGAHRTTVRQGLAAMMDLDMAHLPEWDWEKRPNGGAPVATYMGGPGPIVKMPRIKKSERREVKRRRAKQTQPFQPLLAAFKALAANQERQAA